MLKYALLCDCEPIASLSHTLRHNVPLTIKMSRRWSGPKGAKTKTSNRFFEQKIINEGEERAKLDFVATKKKIQKWKDFLLISPLIECHWAYFSFRESGSISIGSLSNATTAKKKFTSLKKSICVLPNFTTSIYVDRSICQMQTIFPGVEFLRTLSRFKKRMDMFTSSRNRCIRWFHVVVVQWTSMNVLESVMHGQSCCFANKTNCVLTSLSSSLPNRDYGRFKLFNPWSKPTITDRSRQVPGLGNTFSNTLNKRSRATWTCTCPVPPPNLLPASFNIVLIRGRRRSVISTPDLGKRLGEAGTATQL